MSRRRRSRSVKADVIKLIGLGTLLLVMTGTLVPEQGQVVQLLDIEVKCPNCNSELIAPGNMAGQQVKCEACRTVFPLPKPKIMISDAAMAYSSPPAVSELPQLSLALLNQMDWKRFEQLTEGYFQKTGWLTRPNRTGADGGVDIHLFRPGEGGAAAVVQCKAWSTYMVGVKPVRELLGVMTSDKVPQGFFVTSGSYADEAMDFAEKNNITLISGCNLLRKIKELSPSDQEALRDLATKGDYLTPTCPSCGRKMVMITPAKSVKVRRSFWGCPSYPRCKAPLNLKKVEA
jgi:restriction system protein